MIQVKFVNKTKKTVPAGTFVLLKDSGPASHHLVLPEHPNVVGLVLSDVPAGQWGDAEDIGSEPIDDDD